jgi:hypothetical protein
MRGATNVLDGVTVPLRSARRGSADPETAAGAVGAFAMAVTWSIASLAHLGDPSLAVRVIASVVLGSRAYDPAQAAVSVALGLLVHSSIAVMFGRVVSRWAERARASGAPPGTALSSTLFAGWVIGRFVLPRATPELLGAVSIETFVLAHAMLGISIEVLHLIRASHTPTTRGELTTADTGEPPGVTLIENRIEDRGGSRGERAWSQTREAR